MRPGCVLQVEDDANDIYFVQYAFDQTGLPNCVEAARDVREAIDFLSGCGSSGDCEKMPSLVLLDIQLPGGSGFEVLKWIREQKRFQQLPVVILSSSSRPEDIETAYRLGANAYLVKPSGIPELLGLVKCIREFWLVHNRTSSDRVLSNV